MGIFDSLFDSIAQHIAARLVDNTNLELAKARAYLMGGQPRQLRVKPPQFDDNIIINFMNLIANRIVSQMFGNGIEFDFHDEQADTGENPEATAPEQADYIEAVWDANHQEILLHRATLAAIAAGTGYLMIDTNGIASRDGTIYPRLIALDPVFMTITTNPNDFEQVLAYTMTYKEQGRDIAHKKEVMRQDDGFWLIVDSESNRGGKWMVISRVAWPYDFPPIVHWQNLPSIDSCYGQSDLIHLEDLQNRVNFVASNISKLIRYYAHPQRFTRGGGGSTVEVGPDQLPNYVGDNAGIFQLPADADLVGSMAYLKQLRQAMFDIARVVDLDSMQNLGDLSNYRTLVLYQDNINMIGTHRELIGDAIEELNRRLLILNGMTFMDHDVVWPDFVPVNELEQAQALQLQLANNLVSKQTAASILGYDWQTEQDRIDEESTAANAQNANVGGAILNNFRLGGFNTERMQSAMTAGTVNA